MLTKYTKEFKDCPIVRTRDKSVLDTLDIVVDVGGVYDPATHRYDHHQKEFSSTFSENHNIKLSSAGLVYKHFGMEVVRSLSDKILSETRTKLKIELDEKLLKMAHDDLYNRFIMTVDAVDNGVNRYESKSEARYDVNSTLADRVARKNAYWVEEETEEMTRFVEAMKVADEELTEQLKTLILNVLPARPIVEKAVLNRESVSKCGQIIVLETPCPWKEHLNALEKENKIDGLIKFVMYPDRSEGWRIQTVPLAPGSFEFRLGLHKEWRGQALDSLKKISRIEDIVFCHNSGFIGGARSFESVLKMGLMSLDSN